jgi:hypothetical protein
LGRSANSVLKKRVKLGLTRKGSHLIDNTPDSHWADEEINFLIENHTKLTYSEISNVLHRTIRAVMIKSSRLGIIGEGSKWSPREDELLYRYSSRSLAELAYLLNRSVRAIKHRISFLGIDKKVSSTGLELKIEDLIKNLNVGYKTQVILGPDFNFRADFVVDKIVIEAHGDYWHGNPIRYPCPNEMQKLAIEKDQLKKSYFEELGFTVYEIGNMK